MFDALGLACIVLGVNASISNMPKSEFPVLFIASLVIGVLIGTWLDWAGKLEIDCKGRLIYGNQGIVYIWIEVRNVTKRF